MDTYLQRDNTLRSCPYITAIGANTGTRHAQQCRIFTLFNRNAQYSIGTPIPLHILERHLIDIDILGATLRQQTLRRHQVGIASLLDGILPIVFEVLRHHGRGFYLLWRESSTTGTFILLAIDIGRHIYAVESRLGHLAFQRQRTILQHHTLFLHILIHFRSSSIIHLYII